MSTKRRDRGREAWAATARTRDKAAPKKPKANKPLSTAAAPEAPRPWPRGGGRGRQNQGQGGPKEAEGEQAVAHRGVDRLHRLYVLSAWKEGEPEGNRAGVGVEEAAYEPGRKGGQRQ